MHKVPGGAAQKTIRFTFVAPPTAYESASDIAEMQFSMLATNTPAPPLRQFVTRRQRSLPYVLAPRTHQSRFDFCSRPHRTFLNVPSPHQSRWHADEDRKAVSASIARDFTGSIEFASDGMRITPERMRALVSGDPGSWRRPAN